MSILIQYSIIFQLHYGTNIVIFYQVSSIKKFTNFPYKMQQLSLQPFQIPSTPDYTAYSNEHPAMYQQLTITELLSPKNMPNIDTSMSNLKLNKLPSYSSKECMNKIISHYAAKEKNIQSKKHSKYMRNVVKNISTGLTKYYKNQRAIQDILQNGNRCNQKVYDATDYNLNQQQINLQRKYNVSLSIKYASLKEAEEIAEEKDKFKCKQSDLQLSKQPLIVRMRGLIKTFHMESKNVNNKSGCRQNYNSGNSNKTSINLSTQVSSLLDTNKSKALSFKNNATSSQSQLYKRKSRKVSRFTSSTVALYPTNDENAKPTPQMQVKKQRFTHGPAQSCHKLTLF